MTNELYQFIRRHKAHQPHIMMEVSGNTDFVEALPMVSSVARRGAKLEITLCQPATLDMSTDLLARVAEKVRVISFTRMNSRPERVGAMVAVKRADGSVAIGFSKCRVTKDHFNPDLAIRAARSRALTGSNIHCHSIAGDVDEFTSRAAAYFRVQKEEVAVHGYTTKKPEVSKE